MHGVNDSLYGGAMGDLLSSAIEVISRAERRVEVAGQNIANITTPGYKKLIGFEGFVSANDGNQSVSAVSNTSSDYSSGKLVVTGNALDLAIAGRGYFSLTATEGVVYSRQGQFSRDGDGRLVSATGAALLGADGKELVVELGDLVVQDNGLVLVNDRPAGRIALVELMDGAEFTRVEGSAFAASPDAMLDVEAPIIRQGMLEGSNVSLGDEMVSMMEALRRAESAQRLIGVYDDLIGRVITTMGQG